MWRHLLRGSKFRGRKISSEKESAMEREYRCPLSPFPPDECFNGRNNIQLVWFGATVTFEVRWFSCFSLQMRKLRPARLGDLL